MRKITLSTFLIGMMVIGGELRQAEALQWTPNHATGLEWLHLIETKSTLSNMLSSYNATLENIATPGHELYGLRYATRSDVRALFSSYGIPMSHSDPFSGPDEYITITDLSGVEQLQNDIGITFQSGFGGGDDPEVWRFMDTVGYISEDQSAAKTFAAHFILNYVGPLGGGGEYTVNYFDYIAYDKDLITWGAPGSYLVRDSAPVPEPSTLLMLATGLFGLLAYNRKRLVKK